MALSTMRMAFRPGLLAQRVVITRMFVPMASSATDQMKDFWEKNLRLKRPNSPWTVYRMHLPMITSLTHRITGISMGVALYTISIGLFLAPGDFVSYIDMIKSWQLSPLILFPVKLVAAFPLVYHYINGIRHLGWDYKGGYELATQYKTGSIIMGSAMALAVFIASYSYWM